MYGFMDVWMYWIYGGMDVWKYGCMDTCIFGCIGYMYIWMYGICGYMDAWMYGIYGYMDVWIYATLPPSEENFRLFDMQIRLTGTRNFQKLYFSKHLNSIFNVSNLQNRTFTLKDKWSSFKPCPV